MGKWQTGSLVPKLNEDYVVIATQSLDSGKRFTTKEWGEKKAKVEMVFSEKAMLKNNVANESLVKAGLKGETTSTVASAPIGKRKDKR